MEDLTMRYFYNIAIEAHAPEGVCPTCGADKLGGGTKEDGTFVWWCNACGYDSQEQEERLVKKMYGLEELLFKNTISGRK
jgi:Zn ribbon nucleic-acid-binding protein